MNRTADVVVIGGGINGTCTAYALSQRGIRNIVLVEKDHIASGPTGLSSGVVRQHYSHEVLATMARDSIKVWETIGETIGGDAGFVQCGVVFFAPAQQAEALRAVVDMHVRIGIREKFLSARELHDMEPLLHTEDIGAGSYEPDGGYADPALAANSFANACKTAGVEILRKTRVTGISVERGTIRAVVTDKGTIGTDCVVNVAGPWGGRIAEMAGVHIPVRASRHAVVMLHRPPVWSTPIPVWGDLVNGWYFKPDGRTGMMVGSLHDIDDSVDPDDYAGVPTAAEVQGYSEAIVRRFPVMDEGTVHGGWAGLYDVTPDWQPVIDRIPEVERFYCAIGFSGHGFKIGPAIGKAVAELVLDGRCATYDLGIFRYGRFKEQRSSRGAYEYGIVG